MKKILTGSIKDGFNGHVKKVFWTLEDKILSCHTEEGLRFTVAENIVSASEAYNLLSMRNSVITLEGIIP